MKTEKIKFTAYSIAWYEGGIMHLRIKASADSVISIDWGDGHVTNHPFYHSFLNEIYKEFVHNYFPCQITPPMTGIPFRVEISSDNPDCRIIGFSTVGDMDEDNLDVSNCPELEELRFSPYNKEARLDLSRNVALKILECRNGSLTSLDLSSNIALEELYCEMNYLSHLSLMNNFALKKLHCQCNNMEKLFICYAPQLLEAEFELGNDIDEATKMQILELIAENQN